MIRLIIILILPLLVQSQESEFYLEESLDNHISRSIEEEMDVSSNQIQVIYAKYSAEKDNFNFSYFGSAKYFYPASIVKFPILLLALEWLNELDTPKISEETPFFFSTNHSCLLKSENYIKRRINKRIRYKVKERDHLGMIAAKYNLSISKILELNPLIKNPDKVSVGQQIIVQNKQINYDIDVINVSNCIKKILLVSDNNSYNILFHLLGRDYINKKLKEKGFTKTRINKSFLPCDTSRNNYIPGITFIINKNDSVILRKDRIIPSFKVLDTSQVTLNKYYSKGKLFCDTLDFISNNDLPLDEGLKMLMCFLNPTKFNKNTRWNITPTQRDLIIKYMSIYPRESKLEKYSNYNSYPDSYKKYFMFGSNNDTIKSNIRIYNIVGLSSGFTIDIAYIRDIKKKDGFFLAGSMFTNEKGKYSNGYTNYSKQAFPFFSKLGWSIYKDVFNK